MTQVIQVLKTETKILWSEDKILDDMKGEWLSSNLVNDWIANRTLEDRFPGSYEKTGFEFKFCMEDGEEHIWAGRIDIGKDTEGDLMPIEQHIVDYLLCDSVNVSNRGWWKELVKSMLIGNPLVERVKLL